MMMEAHIEDLKLAIESQHGCKATFAHEIEHLLRDKLTGGRYGSK